MNKTLKVLVLRGICLLALGGVLIAYSDNVAEWLVRVCGVLFLLPGLITTIVYYLQSREHRSNMFTPLLGVGSVFLGALLMAIPTAFITALMYILAALLIITPLTYLYSFHEVQRGGIKVSFVNYLFPLAQFAAGIYLILQPLQAARVPFLILGCGFIVGGLMELWTSILLAMLRRKVKKDAKAAEEAAKTKEALEEKAVATEGLEENQEAQGN